MRNAIPTLMIFAAGFGTRMGALTADRPKPMIPVAGRPLIDHALDLARAGLDRIVVNPITGPNRSRAHLAGRPASRCPTNARDPGDRRRPAAALPLLGRGRCSR
jgi:N-acetyl-alpha-D-muramate 1-phosphate uridylyltransferase